MGVKMLILIKTPHETLNYFVDTMAEKYPEAIISDIMSESFFEEIAQVASQFNDTTTVIIFNNSGRSVDYYGRNFWEDKKVKLYNMLVDHPLSYMKHLNTALSVENFIVIDRRHKSFINRYFPAVKVHFLPHGGTGKTELIPYEKREIPLFYCGNCQKNLTEFPVLPYLNEKAEQYYQFAYQKMTSDYSLEAEDVARLYLKNECITLSHEDETNLMLLTHATIERLSRRFYKLQTIKALAENNIPVKIYGTGWEEIAKEYPMLIEVHERITSDECVKYICNSKITLNFMPYFKDGSHERIYIAMLNKSLCLTDRSVYLEEKFEHGKDIVFFNFHQLEVLCDDIKFLLSNPEVAEKIIENAYQKTANSTWSDRLDTILREDFDNPDIV